MEHPNGENTHITKIIEAGGKLTWLVRNARLEVIRGPNQGRSKEIQHDRILVGSSPECDLVLTDPTVSRKHFELMPTDDGFQLLDLGSTNGVLIRGIKVAYGKLFGGEDIELGETVLHLSLLQGNQALSLSDKSSFGTMIGRSFVMRQAFSILEKACQSDSTLLLEGESGTGKDVAAENIHAQSPRRNKPFVVVDCGAITPNLVGSELFGHKKGAFTGADSDRMGAFESGDGGTIFLDEVAELDLSIQSMLLRLLEKRESKRLGENRFRSVNVRIIAATNKNLSNLVDDGRFRQDLFYRLSVLKVRLPPLRHRQEDIIPLAKLFVTRLKPDADPDEIITNDVKTMFFNHDWPGNVRELRNVVERLLLFPEGLRSMVNEEERTPTNLLNMSFREAQSKYTERIEKAYLSAVLDECDGVMSWAAKKAGLPRQTFYRLVTKYKLK